MDNVNIESINLPYSMEAEQAVLGSILMDPSCLTLVQSRGFITEYFYRPEHKAIFNAMIRIDSRGQRIDPLLVLDTLKAENVFDDAAGKTYLFQLAESVPTTANVEAYARIVKEKFFVRSLINISGEILRDATESDVSADMLLDSAEQKIYDIRQGKNTAEASRLSDILTDKVYDRLQALNSDDPEIKGQYIGFTTG